MGMGPAVPAVTIGQLLRSSLRHRPDRILLGEVRGAEAYDLLQGLNTGHWGSLSTIHANSAEEALMRLSHCAMEAKTGLGQDAINEAIGLAIQMVVHVQREQDGPRCVREIQTVKGYDRQTQRFLGEQVYRRLGAPREGVTQ